MSKIMIVDDDSTSLAIGRAFLEDEYEVTVSHSGRQALGALQGENLPDLILLDMLMPGMDGLEVLEILQRDDRLKEIPVIFLTGDRSVNLELRGYTGGAADFLQKPVDRHLLKIKIQQQLSYMKLRRENHVLRKRLSVLQEK